MEMKRVVQLSAICWLTAIVSASTIGNGRQDISLSNDGGYGDILIAISDRVPENPDIITNLQAYFTKASKVLLNATNNRMYFKKMTIVVPSNWTGNPYWTEPRDEEKFEKARILVAEENLAYGDVPYTLQPGGCAEEGDYIHFTPEYLSQNMSEGYPFTPAKTIVKEFSKLKWGLFDETVPLSDTTTSRFYVSDGLIKAVGCVEEISYSLKDTAVCMDESKDGLLLPPCDFIATSVDGTASMLGLEYLDEVFEFCSDGPGGNNEHNKKPMNLQNKMCNERSAWEVMYSLPDFAVDYGTLRSGVSIPDPEFRIVHKPSTMYTTTTISATTAATPGDSECEQDIVCLCLDVSGSMSTNNRIGIMSDSVKIYISTYLRDYTAVGIVAFESYAHLHADMTEITSTAVRDDLVSKVPTSTLGGTNINVGLLECQRILRNYAGDKIDETRIVLLSDGQGTIGDAIDEIVDDGITLDTILYEQGGYLADRAKETGGQEFLASDEYGAAELNQFFSESASRGCEDEHKPAVLNNDEKILLAGEISYTGRIDFDATIGKDTKIVFKYSADISVSITSLQVLTVTIEKDSALEIIVVTIEEDVDEFVEYTITKLVNVNTEVTVLVTASSSPILGVQPIEISSRLNDDDIQFSADTTLTAYLGVFQGLTPVQNLQTKVIIEQPNGVLVDVPCYDDGTGKDSVPNDGIYTGTLPAHKIDGSGGGTYFGLKVDVSGEGTLPGGVGIQSRAKRSLSSDSLGNVTRSATGGVVVINNWQPVEDTTPPEKIADLSVLNAASADDNVFNLGWTAPGDDLNIGVASGYEFSVASDISSQSQITLPPQAISSDVSSYLVAAGGKLEIQINANVITPEMLGLSSSAKIGTYYFRMRTYDAKNNYASWSNPASASYVDPSTIADLFNTEPSIEERILDLEGKINTTQDNLDDAISQFNVQFESLNQKIDNTSLSLEMEINKTEELCRAAEAETDAEISAIHESLESIEIAVQNLTASQRSLEDSITKLTYDVSKLQKQTEVLNQSIADLNTPDCPPTYILNPLSGTCFTLVHQTKNWTDAWHYCDSNGGYLASIGSTASLDWLNNVLFGYPASPISYIWYGARRDLSGEFKWVGTLQSKVDDDLWIPGAPYSESDFSCALGEQPTGYKLYNRPCHYAINFLCEKEAL